MKSRLYSELAGWYRLIDPPRDHADEAASYRAEFERMVVPPFETLLELGAGAGHNALHMKQGLRCTLADISEEMLDLSRELNPDCEHVVGDMRSLRLGRTFDAVLVHDAVVYMLTEADLEAAVRTAFVHVKPGGAAIFAPDCIADTFHEMSEVEGDDDENGERAVRFLEWSWDPDPNDSTYMVEYAFLLREGDRVQMVHDRHEEGLFTRATWERILTGAGFSVETVARPAPDGYFDGFFSCRRPR